MSATDALAAFADDLAALLQWEGIDPALTLAERVEQLKALLDVRRPGRPGTTDELPFMAPADLRDGGYLAEVNRNFFHPLGMALAVDHGRLVVLDGRDDPEGIRFDVDPQELAEKRRLVDLEWQARMPERVKRLGWMVQPTKDPL